MTIPKFSSRWGKPALRIILVVLAVIVVIWCLFIGYHVYDLSKVAKEIQQQEKISLDYDWGEAIHRINGNMQAIKTGLSPFFFVFRLLPDQIGVGHLLRQVDLFTRFSVELTQCGDTLFGGVQPIIVMLKDTSTPTDIGQLISTLTNQSAAFSNAQQNYKTAAEIHSLLDPTVLPGSIRKYYDKLDENFTWLGFGIEMLQVLPKIAGVDQAKTYLVLAQNYDEIRASGGFISGIGTIELAAGKIKKFDLGDSYSIDDFTKDYPWPPMPIQRFMLGEYWVARDGNWSPDFPTAAKQTQDLYYLSTEIKTDGVIAFDQEAIRELLAIFGPVKVASLASPITADNVEQYMLDAWAPDNPSAINNDWWVHRKDFMKEMGSQLLDAMLGTRNLDQLTATAVTIKSLVESGHLLVYFNTPEIQTGLDAMHLAGAVNFGNSPSFMLVDSNIGFNKMDGVMKRSMDLQIDLSDPSQPVATLTVNYENPVKKTVECKHVASYGDGTYADLQTRCYWDYFRVYLPAESQLVSITAPDIPAEWILNHEIVSNPVEVNKGEGESMVIGGLLVVPTNTKQQLVLKVRLPQYILATEMNGQRLLDLKIYKQPGIRALPVTVSVIVPAQSTLCPDSNLQIDQATHQISWKETMTQTYQQPLCLSANQ